MPSSKAGGGNAKKAPPAAPVLNLIEGDIGEVITDDIITPDSAPLATTAGADEVFGYGGIDTIDGGDGDDIIHGGDDTDILSGGNGDDTIFGDAGDDFIFADAGSDTIDGGDGYDTVIYYGELDVDYAVSDITAVVGKGKDRTTVVVGYEVAALDGSGDVDTIQDVEELVFITAPPDGSILTQTDVAVTQFDSAVTIDVLANDFIFGLDPGVGLTVTDIVDIQIDLGDGLPDLIPDDIDFDLLTTTGIYLNDGPGGTPGSILTLDPITWELTWDPNGVYDTAPAPGDPLPVIYFWYEASDGANTAYGDVAIQVAYPAPTDGAIDFDNLTLDPDLGILGIYRGGPDSAFWISQLSTADPLFPFEDRDVAAAGDYDYDNDGDEEFRIWTDPDGTTHELNLTLANSDQTFDVSTVLISDFTAGETVRVVYWSADGNTELGSVDLAGSVSGSGVYDISRTNVGQISIEAGAGDSVYVDDIVIG